MTRRNQKSNSTAAHSSTSTNTSDSNVRNGAIAEIGILHYGDDSNLQDFKWKMSIYAHRIYKDLGHMIELEEYFIPPQVPDPDFFDQYNDPHGGLRATYIERLKLHEKAINEMQSNRTALYSVIWGQLSSESE